MLAIKLLKLYLLKSHYTHTHSYGVVFHTHRFAAFCELTAVTIEGKQLDHISRNVREVPFRRAQREGHNNTTNKS